MILYKKDSKGKIRELEIKALGDMLYQISGLIEGKKVTHQKQCKSKNIGKTNETTTQEQTKIQAQALIIKKIREGYFYSIEEAENTSVIKPMLAKEYHKEKKKLKKYSKIVTQPKLDGIRCVIHYNADNCTAKAFSRTNKPIKNIDPILNDIITRLKNYSEDIIFDGELYLHGKTFQEVSKLVKNPWGERNETPQYWIYDVIDKEYTFAERELLIQILLFSLPSIKSNNIIRVPSILIDNTDESITKQFLKYIKAGYEGMMIRILNSIYKINGRSSDLLKYKEFETITLAIADITPNDVNLKHGTVWTVFNGHLQKSGAKLSHEDREDLLTNKNTYIGRMGEFRYFEETDIGKMRFPVFLGIREDK